MKLSKNARPTDSLSDSLADTTLLSRDDCFCCLFFARRSWFLLSFCLGLATPFATGVSGFSEAVTMVQTVMPLVRFRAVRGGFGVSCVCRVGWAAKALFHVFKSSAGLPGAANGWPPLPFAASCAFPAHTSCRACIS